MNRTPPAPPRDLRDLPQAPVAAAPELFEQLGLSTRRLQETLGQLDAMPRLCQSAQGLPDARGRLGDIARKTGEAADKVLTAVELAKQERLRISAAADRIAQACATADADRHRHALRQQAAEVDAAAARIDAHLTDIMVAQDFHDLTGQMVAKIVTLAIELEDGLLQLLVNRVPGDSAQPLQPPAGLAKSQREVDELLASLGY
jgi:chemotaxis protein CheZ